MKNWKDNNLSAILEYPFDYDRFIEERLRGIEDLEERKFARELLVNGLLRSIHSTEEKYQRLERSVYDAKKLPPNQYEIVMTVINRGCYDPANLTLYPVLKEDLEPILTNTAEDPVILQEVQKVQEVQVQEVQEAQEIRLLTIYLEASMDQQRVFEAIRNFPIVLDQEGVDQQIDCYVRPAKRYRDMIETLYQVFQDNEIPWETINTGYINKFYDVYISNTAFKDELRTEEKIEINFGEFTQMVRYDVIPLWNIKRIEFSSMNFLPPRGDGIYFEHQYPVDDRKKRDGHLIQKNEEIHEICHEEGRIVIRSERDTFEDWNAFRIIQGDTVRSAGYEAPLLTNHKRDSFFRRLAANSSVLLMTKADLFRRIMELDIRDYIEVIDYEICDNTKDFPYTEGMNWFADDYLFPLESRRVLLFKFVEKQPGHYLNDCMMNYAISKIQYETAEYRCVGKLIQPGREQGQGQEQEQGQEQVQA